MTTCEHDWLYARIGAVCPDAVVFSDREGIIRLWNRGAELIFGFRPEDALGRSLDLIIPEAQRSRHWDGYHRVMATGESSYATRLLSAPALRRDGARLSDEFSMVVVRDEGGKIYGVGAIIRDVTERWQREKALRERLAELEKR